jgi:hypothetical protein
VEALLAYAAMPGVVSPVTPATVTTLKTLADVRVLIQHLPEDRREKPTWQHITAQLEQAAAGVDMVDLGIALRLALMLEGLECRAQ